jgi:hypothetical protein
VHILVAGQRNEAAVGQVGAEAVQAGQQPVALLIAEQAGPVQHPGVRFGGGDVVRGEHPVEMGGLAQCGQRGGRAAREAAAPQ